MANNQLGGWGWGTGSSMNWGGGIQAQILATQSANLIGYWPMDETAGSTADNLEGTASRDGTYSGVTLNNTTFGGSPAGLWDGVNDVCDIYSTGGTGLDDVFNGAEGTLMVWMKVSGVGVWTDGQDRRSASLLADGNNYVLFRKASANNTITFLRNGGGTLETATVGAQSSTGWLFPAITWSETGDAVKAYLNGVQQGATFTSIGTWVGQLNNQLCGLGSSGATPSEGYSGNVAHAAIWTKALTAAEILAIYNSVTP